MTEFADLQTAFYITGLAFMGVIFLLLIAMLTAVLVIRSKIAAIQRSVESKLDALTQIPSKGKDLVEAVLTLVGKKSSK